MTLKVVPIRKTAPINDIPAKLRELADIIEGAEEGERYEEVVVLGLNEAAFAPEIYLFGGSCQRHYLAGILMHASQIMVNGVDSPTEE